MKPISLVYYSCDSVQKNIKETFVLLSRAVVSQGIFLTNSNWAKVISRSGMLNQTDSVLSKTWSLFGPFYSKLNGPLLDVNILF